MQKIILFYKFSPLKDPFSVMLWQKTLAEKLNLKGRLIVSNQGINATLGGDASDLKEYIKATKKLPQFKNLDIKWDDGSRDDFPRLSVKVRKELVTFNAYDDIKVTKRGVKNSGQPISPEGLHQLIQDKEVVFFDGRNKYEADTGRFKGAVVSDAQHTRDFTRELSSNKYDHLKDKTIVTYCTGGIRCEVLSALMKQNGFSDVYQLKGGIVSYCKKYKDDGLWHGKLYVFDKRLTLKFSDKSIDIGKCSKCSDHTSNYVNCANLSCNKLILKCVNCTKKSSTYCQGCKLATNV